MMRAEVTADGKPAGRPRRRGRRVARSLDWRAREGAEDPRRRVRGRPRLPLRLHARVVAALEGDVRGGRRSRRHAVPRPSRREPVVAGRAEPDLPRGRGVRGAARRAGAPQGRPLPAPCRGEPRRRRLRPADARDDLARGHAALAPPPRAAGRARAARRGRRLHRADGALPRHPHRPARALRHARSSSTTATCR